MKAEIVDLSSLTLDPILESLKEKRERRFESRELAEKNFSINEWRRFQFIASHLPGGTNCLEVGTGRGLFTTFLVRSRQYANVMSIDIVDRPNLPVGVHFQRMSVDAMSFSDRSIDTVLCCEVLEHLDDDSLHRSISELRRVCAKRLIISVPLNEPMPSKFHPQRFTPARVMSMFPSERKFLLLKEPVMRVPWLFIVDDKSRV